MATSSMEAPLTSSSSPTYSSQSSSSLGLSPMLMSAAAAVAAHANQQNHMQQQQHQQQQVQYRVIPLPQDLGWVDLDFGCSTVCPILPRLIGIWQKWLCSWARRWNPQIKVNPTQVLGQMNLRVGDAKCPLPHLSTGRSIWSRTTCC